MANLNRTTPVELDNATSHAPSYRPASLTLRSSLEEVKKTPATRPRQVLKKLEMEFPRRMSNPHASAARKCFGSCVSNRTMGRVGELPDCASIQAPLGVRRRSVHERKEDIDVRAQVVADVGSLVTRFGACYAAEGGGSSGCADAAKSRAKVAVTSTTSTRFNRRPTLPIRFWS